MDWIVAALAAIPYLLFTNINYVDFPYGSGNYLKESAFCAMLDINISPQVRTRLLCDAYHGTHAIRSSVSNLNIPTRLTYVVRFETPMRLSFIAVISGLLDCLKLCQDQRGNLFLGGIEC